MKTEFQIDVQDLDHLGIIAGIVDEIGIVEVIDKEIGTDLREKVSAGQVVKAMIINCMGFLTAPLYLFSEFFEGKATEHLIGSGIKAEYLNDSRIGRVLDQIYEYGITILFIKIASLMTKRFEIETKIAHIDGTSMAVHGKYLQLEEAEIEQNSDVDMRLEQDSSSEDSQKKDEEEGLEPVPINITHGYSRDHRPDLKQYTLSLLTTEAEGIPLFMQVGSGNELDQKAFVKMIKEFKSQWTDAAPSVYVMDAAFYTESNLSEFQYSIKWISRVPFTIKAAKDLARDLLPEQFSKSNLYKGYQFCSVCHEYAGIKQLWVIVESDERKLADLKSLSKRISKSLAAKLSTLKRLSNHDFACEADALSAAADFEKTLPYHLLSDLTIIVKPHYQRKGRPRPGDEVSHYTYQIQSNLCENEIAIGNHRNQAGRFILATNLLDEERILIASTALESYQETGMNDFILKEYKSQQSTERGFRFIKDPLFFVSRVFLKSTKRIMALAMIMTLALMVYSLGQRQLRLALEQADSTLPNQKGQPTARPTLRWILQCFQSVHLVFIDGIKSRIQLTSRQNLILQFLGASSRQYYFLS
jgi:transposase